MKIIFGVLMSLCLLFRDFEIRLLSNIIPLLSCFLNLSPVNKQGSCRQSKFDLYFYSRTQWNNF